MKRRKSREVFRRTASPRRRTNRPRRSIMRGGMRF